MRVNSVLCFFGDNETPVVVDIFINAKCQLDRLAERHASRSVDLHAFPSLARVANADDLGI
eukprot:scaffold676281_cov125-Prasinocladus_malaysianus.AAC.1